MKTKNHGILKTLTKIQFQNLELNQYQPIDELASFHFNEIKLDYKCEPDPQFCDSVPIFESRLTPVFLPIWTNFPCQHLFPHL